MSFGDCHVSERPPLPGGIELPAVPKPTQGGSDLCWFGTMWRVEAVAVRVALNAALNQFVGNRFTAGRGQIVDLAGATSEQFASVVHTNPAAEGPIAAPSDTVAAVIEVHDDLTLEHLRQVYGRIANAKSLTKTPVPQGETRTNITLGVVWAARTASHRPPARSPRRRTPAASAATRRAAPEA